MLQFTFRPPVAALVAFSMRRTRELKGKMALRAIFDFTAATNISVAAHFLRISGDLRLYSGLVCIFFTRVHQQEVQLVLSEFLSALSTF